jgi:hypothetical protein
MEYPNYRGVLLMKNVSYRDTYNGYAPNYSSTNTKELYNEITQKIRDLMYDMTLSQGRVFYTLYILKYPVGSTSVYPDGNALLAWFIEALIRYYNDNWQLDPRPLWITERSTTGHYYHLLLLLDSEDSPKRVDILKKATEIWQGCLGIEDGRGLVHSCKSVGGYVETSGVKNIRDYQYFYQCFTECLQRARYLVNCHYAGKSPARIDEFACSTVFSDT